MLRPTYLHDKIEHEFDIEPAVLIPGFDLCVGQVKPRGQLFPLVHAEIFLSVEATFKISQLLIAKRRSCFAPCLLKALRARIFVGHRSAATCYGLIVLKARRK